MVFQGVREPFRDARKSLIRLAVPGLGSPDSGIRFSHGAAGFGCDGKAPKIRYGLADDAIAFHPIKSGIGPPRDLAGIDVENLTGTVDVGECGGIGTGHPDLRPECCQFVEQRLAPCGVKMRHHLVEQQ
jgi:hypothetical protein